MTYERTSSPFARLDPDDHLPVDYGLMRSESYMYINQAREALMGDFLDAGTGRFREELLADSPCLSCSASDFTELFQKEGLRFVECRACGLIQVNPLPVQEVADLFYNSETYNRFMQMHEVDLTDYRKSRFGQERVDAWEMFLGKPSASRPMTALDVGCAGGFVLEVAGERGWNAFGIDLNPRAVEAGRKRGLDLRQLKFEALDVAETGAIDVVAMYDLLEHTYNPREMVSKAFEVLRPGGLFVVYVPNWNSLVRLILGKEAFFIWGIFHLTYFTADTLGRLLTDAGFGIERIETQGMDVADLIWREENRGAGRDMSYCREHMEAFQFVANAGGWGNNLRVYARKPGGPDRIR